MRRPRGLRTGLPTLLVATLLAAGLTACSTGAARGDAVHDLPTSGIPDYQLGGAYTPPAGVTVVERDSTARPAPDIYGICYVNGFQTQPQEAAAWERDRPSALLRTAAGAPFIDPGWPDEVLFDTSTAAHRALVLRGLEPSIARCADRGFDAVEFDNLDSWTRSEGALTRADALALAKLLVTAAHRHGLAAGQKNTAEIAGLAKRTAGFDFAVAEECAQYDECGAYTKVYGDRVIDVEYTDELRDPFSEVCASRDRPAMTILRDRELVAASRPGYHFEHC